MLIAVDGKLAGLLAVADPVRGNAKESIAQLRAEGLRIVMLTGDNPTTAAEVRIGRDAGGQTEILAGLGEGEKVVASGQFLLNSEASLSGIPARPIGGDGK